MNEKQLQGKVSEILVNNGLNFRIDKEPLTSEVSGRPSGYFGLYNSVTNECLNTVGENYTVSQNDEIVEVVLRGMNNFGNLSVHKAASINGGRRIVCQLAIEGESKVNKDVIKRYVTIIDSNDGSTALSVGIGDITMSCLNQFFRFYKAGNAKFRHTATMAEKLKTIPSLIEIALGESMKQVEIYNKMAQVKATPKMIHELVGDLLGHSELNIRDKNITGKALSHMEKLYGNINHEMADKGKTVWGLFSGATRWTTHDIAITQTKRGKMKRNNADIESMTGGRAYAHNQTAYDYAVKQLHKSVLV